MTPNETPGRAEGHAPGLGQGDKIQHSGDASVGQSTSMLDIALTLLDKGLHVFPLGGVSEDPPDYFVKERFGGDVEKARSQWPKQPRIGWKTFQTAPPTEETVRD